MSSVAGTRCAGNRRRSASTTSRRVVDAPAWSACRYATRSGSSTATVARRRRRSATRVIRPGASPSVPSVSSWSSWPTNSTVSPRQTNRFASVCTFATSGQVASMTFSPRRSASLATAGATPCAENTTAAVELSGTSSSSSTNTAPRAAARRRRGRCARSGGGRRPGAGNAATPRSTMSIARSTPAQNERGPASSTVRGPAGSAHSRSSRADAGAACAARSRRTAPCAARRAARAPCRRPPGRPRSGRAPRARTARTIVADSMSTASAPLAASRSRSAARDDVVGAHDRPGVYPSGRGAQFGHQRCRAAQHGSRRVVADLGRHDDVARPAAPGSRPPADPGDDDRVGARARSACGSQRRTRAGPMPHRASSRRRAPGRAARRTRCAAP